MAYRDQRAAIAARQRAVRRSATLEQTGQVRLDDDTITRNQRNQAVASPGPATQILETSGPDTLDIGDILDGQLFIRVGDTVIGVNIEDIVPVGIPLLTPHVFLAQELEYTFAGRSGATCPLAFNPDDGRAYTAVAGYLLELDYENEAVAQIADTGFSGSALDNPICVSNEGHIYVGGTGAGGAKTLFKVDEGTHAVTDLTAVFVGTAQARFMCNVPSLGSIFVWHSGAATVDELDTATDTMVNTGYDLGTGDGRPFAGMWYVDHDDNVDGYLLVAYGTNGDGKTKLHVVEPATFTSIGNVLISSNFGTWAWNHAWDSQREIMWLSDQGGDYWEIDLTDPTTPVATKRTVASVNAGGLSYTNPIAYVPATDRLYFFDNGSWDRLGCLDYDNNFLVKQTVLLTSRAVLGSGVWPHMDYNPYDGCLYLVQSTDTITITRVVP